MALIVKLVLPRLADQQSDRSSIAIAAFTINDRMIDWSSITAYFLYSFNCLNLIEHNCITCSFFITNSLNDIQRMSDRSADVSKEDFVFICSSILWRTFFVAFFILLTKCQTFSNVESCPNIWFSIGLPIIGNQCRLSRHLESIHLYLWWNWPYVYAHCAHKQL